MQSMARYFNKLKAYIDVNDIQENQIYDHQKEAHKLILEGNNISVDVPTGLGKTLDGCAALAHALYIGLTGVYLVPRILLLHQKVKMLKQFFEGIARVITIQGDVKPNPKDLKDPWGKLIIVATYESFRAFLFSIQKRKYFDRKTRIFGAVVIDEAHMLGDKTHGAALETMLYKLLSYQFLL